MCCRQTFLNDSNLLKGQQKRTFRFEFPLQDTVECGAKSKTEVRNSMSHAECPLLSAYSLAGSDEESNQCVIDVIPCRFISDEAAESNATPEVRISTRAYCGEHVLDEDESSSSKNWSKTTHQRDQTQCTTHVANSDNPFCMTNKLMIPQYSEDFQREPSQAATNMRGNFTSKKMKGKSASSVPKQVRFSA
jgi:hypothetical protein